MHLLIAGFASIGYLHGEAGPRDCHLSLSAVCDCWWYFLIILTIFDVSAVGSVKQNLSRKSVTKLKRLLSCFASSSPCCGLVYNV